MNTIQRYFMKALASLMLAGLCLCITANANAQCPTDIAPTTGPGSAWAGPIVGTLLMPGTTDCYVIYHYCQRIVNAEVQYYIEDFGPYYSSWGTDCHGTLWYDILNAVKERLFQTTTNVEDCGGLHVLTTTSIFSGQCAEMTSSNPIAIFCGGAYCKKTCDLCYNTTTHQIDETNCSITVVGTASCNSMSDWSTLTVNAVVANTWGYNYNQCYFIDCSGS